MPVPFTAFHSVKKRILPYKKKHDMKKSNLKKAVKLDYFK